MPSFKKVFFVFFLLIAFSIGLIAQENNENENEDKSGENSEVVEPTEPTEPATESADDATAEEGEMSDEEYEKSLEEDKSGVTVNFVFGDILWLDRYRAKSMYPDFVGWWPEVLVGLGVNVPSGIDNMRLEFTGLAINDNPTSFVFAVGGGIQTKSYSGGTDGRHIKYSEHQDFWGQQDRLRDRGQNYVDRNYETAFAWWKLQWNQKIVLPDPTVWMNFHLGYKGLFRQWLTNPQDNGLNIEYYLPQTDLPDKEKYILNTLFTGISFGKTEYPDVPFTHGLETSIGTSFNCELAPWFMNMHLDDLLDTTNQTNWILLKDYFGKQVTDYYGAFVKIPRKTADYYKVQWSVYGKRGMWDIAPERKSNWFSGRLDWDLGVRWFDKIGNAGYIPLEVRGDYAKRFETWATLKLVMNLPTITIADLKGWSTPEANVEFEKVEESFANFLNFFGFQVDAQSWGNYKFLWADLNTYLYTNYSAELDPENERTFMVYYNQRSSFDMYIKMEFKLRVMQIFYLGFETKFDIDGRWANAGALFDLGQ
ncbi:MAG: hypothetical protein JXR63_08625 [Spirochaetales bacterium]|nr:hypothetical protein [Spirochaetales bacterium]